MIIKRFQSSLEEALQLALTKIPNEDVNAFMSLSNSLPDCAPLARTNMIGTGDNLEKENVREGRVAYFVVGKLASRINHKYVAIVPCFSSDGS